MSTASRRTKWHPTPPPPPSPKILHISRSRRTRRKLPKPNTLHHHHHHAHHRSNSLLRLNRHYLSSRGNPENLFDKENNELPKTNEPHVVFLNSNSKTLAVERREKVEEKCCGEYDGGGANGFEQEKWMFQVEMLRAECNFLRMERELALKKLEKNRVKMEKTLRSAVQTLVSGRKKIFEGKNANAVLEKEIEDLSEKLEELQKSSRIKDNEVGNCSNFDKKAWLLQRRLEKLGELSNESCLNEWQELAESINTTRPDTDKQSSVSNSKTEYKSNEVDKLRKKMEGMSRGMTDRVEEDYGSVLSSTANSSKGIECPNFFSFSSRPLYQEQILHGDNRCSGHCKAIIRKIVEQVRAETEQWSQMQEMLGQVRGEMEELQASRDFWQNRAYNSDCEIQSLKYTVEEWKEKAHGYEIKANELQVKLALLREELRKTKADINLRQNRAVKLIPDSRPIERLENQHFDEQVCKFEKLNIEESRDQGRPISLGKQLAKEKRMLLHRLKVKCDASEKEKPHTNGSGVAAWKRSPLRDIGNSSSLATQNGAVFPFDSPERALERDSKGNRDCSS